jgi:hypothetical protein
MKYTEIETTGGEKVIQANLGEGKFLFIPKDPANSDYQRYLNPDAEQSTPMIPGDE